MTMMIVCGDLDCTWWIRIDPTNPLKAHQLLLDHQAEHDPDEQAECEATDRLLNVFQAAAEQECPSCHAQPGQPHTDYCRLPAWAAHDAEVARCLAEDRIPAAPGGGFYNGQLYDGGLYAGDSPEQIAAEQARVDRFMAGGEDR